jgi:hypothetical protein
MSRTPRRQIPREIGQGTSFMTVDESLYDIA